MTQNVLERFEKQGGTPDDLEDFDITYVAWLAKRSDTISSILSVTADDGITVAQSSHAAGVVKVWLSGGTVGTTYLVQAQVLTTGGRKKTGRITVKVV